MQITLGFALNCLLLPKLIINPYFHIFKSPQEEQSSNESCLFFRDLVKLVSRALIDAVQTNQAKPNECRPVILRLTEDGGGGAWR